MTSYRKYPVILLLICFAIKTYAGPATEQTVTVTLRFNQTAQQIRNIGASGCWYSENIGRYWPEEKKKRIAELLFSREMDQTGSPQGIGLSAWRFNIGGGTAEQGDQSGIRDPQRRVECFLDSGGRYDWNKQSGYQWFLKQAALYNVTDLIAFCNTPPVFFTRNSLGYKTVKDGRSNLSIDKYAEFAEFLVTVIRHFDEQGIHFDYLSPVNEPQWDWSYEPGKAGQEGCPWLNEEIYKIVTAIDQAFTRNKLQTGILIPEAARLDYLYKSGVSEDDANKSQQIQAFWNPDSDLHLGSAANLCKFVAGHSYFTDNGDEQLISTRQNLARVIQQQDNGLEYWQSEYCLLGNGYRDGRGRRIGEMDYALFLAKVIHHDLVVGRATAWHYWNAYEPGRANRPRYYLIALSPNRDGKDGDFTVTKNLWAMGHYSRFVRPGMKRLVIQRSDNLTDLQAARQLMISAFVQEKTGAAAVVIINYQDTEARAKLNRQDFPASTEKSKAIQYITTEEPDKNMKAYPLDSLDSVMVCPPRSVTTVTF